MKKKNLLLTVLSFIVLLGTLVLIGWYLQESQVQAFGPPSGIRITGKIVPGEHCNRNLQTNVRADGVTTGYQVVIFKRDDVKGGWPYYDRGNVTSTGTFTTRPLPAGTYQIQADSTCPIMLSRTFAGCATPEARGACFMTVGTPVGESPPPLVCSDIPAVVQRSEALINVSINYPGDGNIPNAMFAWKDSGGNSGGPIKTSSKVSINVRPLGDVTVTAWTEGLAHNWYGKLTKPVTEACSVVGFAPKMYQP